MIYSLRLFARADLIPAGGLGESAEKPRYFETVARRGYRFLGEVEAVETPASEPSASEPPAPDDRKLDACDFEGEPLPLA